MVALRFAVCISLATILVFAHLGSGPVAAQPVDELEKLNQRVIQLYQAGKYAEAVPIAERYAEGMKARHGADAPQYATVLNNLAGLLQATNRLAEAEPLIAARSPSTRRASAPSIPTSPGPQQPGRAAAGHQPAGRGRAAVSPRARHRREELRPRASQRRQRLNNLAQLLQATNRLAEAEPLYRRALAIDEKSFGPEHPDVAIASTTWPSCCRPPTGWPRPSR